MRNKQRLITGVLLVITLLLVSTLALQASSGGSYEIDWFTMDGGGAMQVETGSYGLSGTIGQLDVGSSTNGQYTLDAGFWVMSGQTRILLPFVSGP